MLRSVPISELAPGMMVTRVLEQHGPVKIRRVGLIKSEAMVKGLTEMGVSLLEVDDAQSFTLEATDALNRSTQSGELSPTPTQRLMEKDKQSGAVDRQLSQQFHRSLFMPAIDEMPSKWQLYFRPYALLSAFALIGFAFGFLAINIATNLPSWFKGTSQSTVEASRPLSSQDLVVSNDATPDISNAVGSADVAFENGVLSAKRAVQNSSKPDESSGQKTDTQLSQPPSDVLNQASLDAGSQNVARSDNNSSTSDALVGPEETVRSFQTLNGIVLNEGETVLGYGVEDEQNDIGSSSESTAQDALTTEALSADLLSRVNRAAAQLEAEQELSVDESPEPLNLDEFLQNEPVGPVMDLRVPKAPQQELEKSKPIVRIDQLPAALLTQMPAMSFSAHMYASNPQDRWVRVNGRRLSEGDFIDDGLSIVEIESERIVLAFKGETFTMNALSDW